MGRKITMHIFLPTPLFVLDGHEVNNRLHDSMCSGRDIYGISTPTKQKGKRKQNNSLPTILDWENQSGSDRDGSIIQQLCNTSLQVRPGQSGWFRAWKHPGKEIVKLSRRFTLVQRRLHGFASAEDWYLAGWWNVAMQWAGSTSAGCFSRSRFSFSSPPRGKSQKMGFVAFSHCISRKNPIYL